MKFGTRLRDALLLVFFTAIGLSAKLAALRSGGRPLLILCGVTVVALVLQNVSGAALALAWGAHPAYGVLIGSLSFVGGPGTAMAWASELQAAGLQNAPVVAVGAATLAVVVGALVSGPVTGWIIGRHKLRAASRPAGDITFTELHKTEPGNDGDAGGIERLLSTVLVIAMSNWTSPRSKKVAPSRCSSSS